MALDVTKPTDSGLLINAPGQIRANWDAMVLGTDASLLITNAKVSPSAAITESKILFSGSGHGHTGSTDGLAIVLTTAVTGTLPLANGGTGQTSIAGLGNLFYPVGSIYCNATNATNPGTLLGFGTWVAMSDEVLVGKNSSGTFDTLGTVPEGEETHVITVPELAAHTHTSRVPAAYEAQSSGSNDSGSDKATNGVATSSTGSNTAHNNIQPSYVVYMWRRTV